MIRAIRGATTAENTKDSIEAATTELLQEVLAANNLEIDQIVSILFTATTDLDAAYPAAAARVMGMTNVSLMCVQEMCVVGSLQRCIRAQVLAEIDIAQSDVRHIYLKEARQLRPDLIDGQGQYGK